MPIFKNEPAGKYDQYLQVKLPALRCGACGTRTGQQKKDMVKYENYGFESERNDPAQLRDIQP
jgi:predicted metal-binding protein